MPPEVVVVTFPRRRPVFMDNQPMGQTGDQLIVQTGFHDFDLGSPQDYTPPSQLVNVTNTTPPNSMVVAFAPLAMASPAAPVPPPPPLSMRAKGKAKAAKKKAARKTAAKKTAAKKTARRR